MRILYVIDSLGAGGTETSLAELVAPLTRAGASPTIVCLEHRRDGVQHLLDGADVRVLRTTALVPQVREVAAIARAVDADLLHTMLFRSDIVGRLAGRVAGVPVVSSLVSTSYGAARRTDPRLKVWRVRFVRAADGFTARHLTRALHAVSHAVKAHAVAMLGVPSERITVVERGRDPDRLGVQSCSRTARARATLGLGADAEVLVNVGRRDHPKGQRHLLDAVALLASARPRLELLVAGREGSRAADLERQRADCGLADRVRFLGHRRDVPEVLAAADIFVSSSLYEGLPGAMIEAMALSLPVVAADIPAVREVVEPDANALLVPPADPAALAKAIATLLDDDARRRAFGARGREIFLERFALDHSVARMRAFYESVLSSR